MSTPEEIVNRIKYLQREKEKASRHWEYLMFHSYNWPRVNSNSAYSWNRFFEAEKRYRVKESSCKEEIEKLEKVISWKNSVEADD